MSIEYLLSIVASVLVVLFVLPLHEYAHAYMAVKAGDPTPKIAGRYTLNPLKHFDIVGLLMLIFVHFGWAKPVPINVYNFRNLKKDYFAVSIAGIVVNMILALIFSLLLAVFDFFVGRITKMTESMYYLLYFIKAFLTYGVTIDIGLAVFNLIPVHPLDGFRIMECFIKRRGRFFYFLATKGIYVLYGLLFWSAICSRLANSVAFFGYLDVFGLAFDFVTGGLTNLIMAFWGLFF